MIKSGKSDIIVNMKRVYWLGFMVVVLACALILGCSDLDKTTQGYEDILVKRVVDGDTLVLQNNQRVRLIGIDTPEVHMSNKLYRDAQRSKKDIQTIIGLGKKSSEFTRQLVGGKRVRLEFDVEKYDRYGRLLCYVYLLDGTFVNAKIVEEGYASLLTIPPNVKYSALLQSLYQQARQNNRGLWKE